MNRRSLDRRVSPASRKQPSSRGVSPLVGRDEEMRQLASALSSAAEGQGGVVLLTGEPCIGKTRLAHEALALARERGFTVLEGRSFPMEAGLAYAPFIDAFGPLLHSLDSACLKVLVSDLPSLGRLFEGLRLPPPSFPLEGLNDPALEKTHLFEAVLRLVERLAQEAPVALFVDDLHLADPASLDLLLYLARSLSNRKALLVATYSAGALDATRDLLSLIVLLQRGGLAQEIVLPRLGRDALEKLARAILGGEAPADLLALLHARCGGSPLFVEAFIAALVDSGGLVHTEHGWSLRTEAITDMPQSVRRLILERLAWLAPAERRALDVIAVIGEAASHAIIRAACALEEESLDEALRHLRASGLVAEGIDGSDVAYVITHPLIQEVAYAEMTEATRRRIQAAAIQMLERLRLEDPSPISGRNLNLLARYYRGIGSGANPSRAVGALVGAGERALSLCANEEAVRHFEAALSVVREYGCSVHLDGYEQPLLPRLLEQLGEAWNRVGEGAAAVEVWNEALVLLSEGRESTGDTAGASRLRRRLALAELEIGRIDVASAHLGMGLEALAGHEPSLELADLQFARFHILNRLGDVTGVTGAAAELLSLAERLTSPLVEAEANVVASVCELWQNDVAAARERAYHALKVGEQMQDALICCRAHLTLMVNGMRLGEHHLMRHHAERGLAVVRRLGAPRQEALLYIYSAHASFLSGDWSDSLRLSMDAISLARRAGHPPDLAHALAGRSLTLVMRGDWLEAESCIAEARQASASDPFGNGPVDRFVSCLVDISETALALERDHVDRALTLAKGSIWPAGSALLGGAGLAPPYMPMGLMLLAEVQAAAGEAESALETARKIGGLSRTGSPYLSALASRAEGLARRALGQREAATACLSRAYQMFREVDMPFEAARALLEQGEEAINDRCEMTVSAVQKILAIFERLNARRYAERTRLLLRRLGILPIATIQPRLGMVPVSERELEIARLVTEGLTRAEIASRLTISPFTVNAHLGRLYARLNIGSRAALARLVVEAGLLQRTSEIS